MGEIRIRDDGQKPEGKKIHGRFRRRWEDNIKMDFKEMYYEGVDWNYVFQDRIRWPALVSRVMNLLKGRILVFRFIDAEVIIDITYYSIIVR
jgi:hypothetical protein